MKYALITANKNCFDIVLMCRALAVSRGGYYDWRRRPPSAQSQDNVTLDAAITDVFTAQKGRAGSPRVTLGVQANGISAGRHRVARRMKKLQLRAKAAKKFKATTNSNHHLPVADNLLNQNFHAAAANQKWVSDITYVPTDEGWLYVAVVMDLYSRLVVGWAMAERMTATLVMDALQMALWRRKKPRGVILHSDRGSQYCSHDYQRLIRSHHLICSMSKKGDCYDNAAMESWNHSLKVEAVHGERFVTRTLAKEHLFDYIEVYYNRQRLHSTIGYLSPEAFEAKKVA